MCSGGQWAQGDVVSTCKALVEPANGVAGDVYESGFNVKKSPYFLIQTIPNGSDGCCGDDLSVKGLYATGADYGYFDSSNKGMCYANISDLSAPETAVWNWKRASQTKSFEIWPLYLNNSKTVDVISNGDEWYYCNANSNFSKGLTANVLNETQQPIPKGGDNTIACADVMNTLYSKININGAPIMFTSNESCGPSTAPCCGYTDPQTQSFNVGLDKMSDCADYCYVNGATVSFDLSGQSGVGGWNCVKNDPVKDWLCPQDSGSGTANPGTQDDPTTTVCHSYDTSGCIGTIITKDHLCSELGGIDCASNNNICSLGTLVGSSDSSECCYSAIRSTKCLPKRDINSAVDCVTNFSGIAYNTTTEICNGEEQSILNNNLRCCFNTKSTKNLGISKLFASTIKTSLPNIMCYKDSTGNYLAECIYDDWSVNMKFVPGGKLIDASNGRLMSIGSSIHTIMSFDIIINRSVVDRQKNLSLLQTGNYLSLPQNQWIATQQPKPIKPYDLSKYDYLEFDVSYPTLTCQLTVVLAYNTLAGTSLTKTFSLCPYLTQGDRSYRWNHVKINLTELGFMKGDIYDYLIFRDYTPSTQQYNILLDNIKVSSNDNSINTPSEYCTGGYGKWLNNLDPNSSITDYNPYAAACNAQESYGWTGTMCCGDDTGYNYGEFYNDTVSGCFNGSIIDNDRTVSYASGVRETGINFDSYIFKGLLYYNNSFIGCQVDTSSSPFSTLVRSKDGKVYYPNNDLIVSQIYSNQCSVVGSYYCSNSAWRKLIKVSNTSYTDFNGKEMYLKTVPAGVELIKNGFRGTN